MTNERKRANSAKEQGEEHGRATDSAPGTNDKPERPIDWDARDLEADTWVR